MRKLFVFFVTIIALFMLVSAAGAKGGQDDRSKFNDREKVDWAIKKVQKATEKYKNIDRALKDGYELASPLVPNMGFHYVKGSLVDGKVNALHPEALLYVPTEKGLKLVGVEYLSTTDNSLFGRKFDPPHDGIPFSLHAWIWAKNPDGTFTPFNPNVANGHEH